ncbi:MAG: FeoA family protein [Spirochaetales bacterium]|nr:FeoA family protein [Spirochaetales bacterium]
MRHHWRGRSERHSEHCQGNECCELEKCPVTAADLRAGQKACIAHLGRGRSFRARMLGLGVRPGAEMKIINGAVNGPCLIEVNRRRVMLGHEMLSGIILEGENI